MNTTIGFIPFRIPQIKRPYDLYEKYFGTFKKAAAEQLFGTAIGFTKACQMGSIGINAMEPKGFRDCIEKGSSPVYSEKDENKQLNFHTYQIWLLAMLNNEQLWEHSHKFAVSLSQFARSSSKGKTDKSNLVDTLLKATNQKQFLEGLTPIVQDNSSKEDYTEMAKLLHMMPKDNVPYFLTLIRFHFATIK